MRPTYPFHLLTATLFSLVTLLVGGAIGAVAYTQQRQLLLTAVTDIFARSLRESQSELAATYLPVEAQLGMLADAIQETRRPEAPEQHLRMLVRFLENNPGVSSITVERDHAGRLTVTPLPHADARRRVDAPPQAAYRLDLARERQNTMRFFDAVLAPLGGARAMSAAPAPVAGPSLWVSHGAAPGVRLSATIGLKNLSATLSRLRATPSTQLGMLDSAGHLLASSHGAWPEANDLPTLTSMDLPILAAVVGQPIRDRIVTLEHGGRRWQTLAQASEIAPGIATLMVMAAPHDEVLAGADQVLRRTLLITLIGLGLTVPLIWRMAHRITDSLRRLARAAADARAFRFSVDSPRSIVREVDALSQAMRQMAATMQRFLDISARLATEHHFDQLLDAIVAEAIAGAEAGAGAVYLFQDNRRLQPMAWRWMGGEAPLPPAAVVPQAASCFDTALTHPAPAQFVLVPGYPQPGLEWIGAWFPGQSVQVLMVPLRNRSGDALGLLLVARGAKDQAYDPDLVAFIDALSGTMAVTIEKQSLLEGRKALLDGVIRMIAGAIDARSPYTSGHCRRVPELVDMLADAAASHPASPYRHLPMKETAREALRLAAWLHDCGKLFVPDYITDKAVKLEAVYNRIHEIRARFEILKRDAEVSHWRGIAEGGEPAALLRELQATQQALDADYAFVAACNEGDRRLDEEDIARLLRIGARTWLRTLDDRLGISELERRRKAEVPARALPAPEHLLADRLEHLVDVQAGDNRDTAPESRGNMPRPKHRDRRCLRGADGDRSSLQAGQVTRRSAGHHGRHGAAQTPRSGTLRPVRPCRHPGPLCGP